MSQIFDRQILDYLARKENLSLALEIGTYAAQLRRELFEKFWKRVQGAINDTRPKGRAADEFVFRDSGAMNGEYSRLGAIPKAAAVRNQHLAFTIEHEHFADKYDLYIGLRWARNVRASEPLYERAPLRKLKERLVADRWEFWAPAYVCGRYVQQFPSPENFLCAFADDPAGVLDPLTTAFWEMVRATETDVTAINKLVATQ